MKNIYLLPTDQPSRLVLRLAESKLVLHTPITQWNSWHGESQHIYITSDEEIKADDWCINLAHKQVVKPTLMSLNFLMSLIIQNFLMYHQFLMSHQ